MFVRTQKNGLSKAIVIITLMMVFGAIAQNTQIASAQEMHEVFFVPIVSPVSNADVTKSGARIVQPHDIARSGSASETQARNVGRGASGRNNLVPLTGPGPRFTADELAMRDNMYANLQADLPRYYHQPAYDPFATGLDAETLELQEPAPLRPKPEIDFDMIDALGRRVDYGTTATNFSFRAQVPVGFLIRYKINGPNFERQSAFSNKNQFQIRLEEAGVYEITLEATDGRGLIAEHKRLLTVVNNEKPISRFSANRLIAPQRGIISFNTGLSSDNQYPLSALEFRFDFNGDGVFDTPFESKTNWNHRFENVGKFRVRMQVRDPEGLTTTSSLEVEIVPDQPPVPILKIEKAGQNRYLFDATDSFDDFSVGAGDSRRPLDGRLEYRFDIDYQGPNDITFDRDWSTQGRFYFTLSDSERADGGLGQRTIRLQVRDQFGWITQVFRTIGG